MRHDPPIPDELLALRDDSCIQKAREAADTARLNLAAATERLADAAGKVKTAIEAREALVKAAVADPDASKTLRACESRIAEAERAAVFAGEVTDAANAEYRRAGAAIRQAERDAWMPVVRAGIDLRMAAARRYEELRRQRRRAEELFEIGAAAMRHATAAGYDLLPLPPGSGLTTQWMEQMRRIMHPDAPSLRLEEEAWKEHLTDDAPAPVVEALIAAAGCGS